VDRPDREYLLFVDLSSGRTRREEIPPGILRDYLGGRGLGARLLRGRQGLPPCDPASPIVFAAGPLCGTGAPAASRLGIVCRSPLTGTVCHADAGGGFAGRRGAAGLLAILVEGKSPRPVSVVVTPSREEIVPADALWGAGAVDTVQAMSGHGSVAAVGPAGENGVLFAGILVDRGNVSGRGGPGAVMGSKNLKAVAVDGDLPVPVADPARVKRARADVIRLFRASPALFGDLGIGEYGTPALIDLARQRRMSPTENFRLTVFEGSSAYSGPAIRKAFPSKRDYCPGCPVGCGRIGPAGKPLPEFDAASHFGALNGIRSLEAVVLANDVCNEMGMDPVSAAATLAAWGEARGRFASPGELIRLLRDTALRRGEGLLLADGSRRAMEALGRPELSMSVKSMELPAFDPRGAYGTALMYCTSNHGGGHLPACPLPHEVLRKPAPADRFTFSGKARLVRNAEDAFAAADSLGVCRFALLGASLEEYAELLWGAAGEPRGAAELAAAGERVHLLERSYNAENGFTRKDDALPARFFEEGGSSGEGFDVPPIDRARFEEELTKYYRIRGLRDDGSFPGADPRGGPS
jgi:aldehyde:ferredoxin oxidoreductase